MKELKQLTKQFKTKNIMKKTCLFLTQAVIALSLVFAVSCNPKDDDDKIPKGGLKIGDSYQGGIVAYIDGTGKHGLIAAPKDQSPGVQWYNGKDVFLVTTGTAIGTGKNNTKRIVQMQGNGNYAAKLCDDLVLNGYDDWFLPSIDELNELYKNRLEIGGFDYTGIYWTSSEGVNRNDIVYYQYFSSGNQSNNYKNATHRVRAVRAF